MENNTPMDRASTTCFHDNWKYGNINISAPVLINNGGRIIFNLDVGLCALLIRIIAMTVIITKAKSVVNTIITFINYFVTLISLSSQHLLDRVDNIATFKWFYDKNILKEP